MDKKPIKQIQNKKNKAPLQKEKQATFKKGEISHAVMAVLGIGVLLGGTIFITPNFPIVVGGLLKLIEEIKGLKLPKKKLARTLKVLEKKKIIGLERKDSEVYVTIKDKWNVEVVKYSIEAILSLKKTKKKWSGKWYLVLFDVPEEEKNKRDYLRSFLKEVGFYPYQQSVYVFPYECEREIDLIRKIVEGAKYLNYLVAERLEREDELKRFFKL